jgi:hypothetical protein
LVKTRNTNRKQKNVGQKNEDQPRVKRHFLPAIFLLAELGLACEPAFVNVS